MANKFGKAMKELGKVRVFGENVGHQRKEYSMADFKKQGITKQGVIEAMKSGILFRPRQKRYIFV